MTTLGLSLLWSAVQATLIGLVAVVLGARPWRVGGAITPLLALLSIALITICSFLPLPGWWPTMQVVQTNGQSAATQSFATNPAFASLRVDESREVVDQLEALPATAPASSLLSELAANFVDELKSVRSQADQRWTRSSIPLWVVGVFAIGVAIGLVRLVLGVLGVRDIRRRSLIINDQSLSELLDILQAELGLKSKVELRQAKELSSAATVGYFAPVILLPEQWRSWQPDELRAVLGHELAHIHHQDYAAQFLAQLGLVLHFYNPIVHWLSERMKLEQELAADAVAASLAGGQRQYLRVLATLALDHQNQLVGWPARAFLPTRHSFLRRLEMLRVMNAPPARPPMAGRLIAVAVMILLTIGLVTLRPESGMRMAEASGGPIAVLPNAAEPATTIAQESQKGGQAAEYELRYLGEDVELVGGLRPVELLKSRQLKLVYDALGSSLNKEFETLGVKLEEVEQAVGGFSLQTPPMPSIALYVRLSKPLRLDAEKVQGKLIDIKGRSAIETRQGAVYWQPDERSIVMNSRRHIERFIDGRLAELSFTNSGAWSKVKHEPAFALMTGKLARQLDSIRNGGADSPQMQLFQPLFSPVVEESAFISIGASLANELRLTVVAECQDEKGTKVVDETTTAGSTLLKNSLRAFTRTAEGAGQATPPDAELQNAQQLVAQLTKFGLKALENLEVRTDGKLVTLSLRVPASEFPLDVLVAATNTARRAAQRSVSMNNLKQLGLGFHNYHDAYTVFPTSAAIRVSETQTPYKYPYSWRVAILPFIEQAPLYNKYKFDEPWDSPSNLEVLKQMPATYRYPDAPADSTTTSYVALAGKDTLLPIDKGMKISEVTDGLSNTIMIVEAKSSIPWTKPEDYAYDADNPLPVLGGYSEIGYNVLFGDGSVKFFAKSVDQLLIRKMLTARGGEVIP